MSTSVCCPSCTAAACRKSRWRSHEERAAHPGMHPFRCPACGDRFLAPVHPQGSGRRWPMWAAVGAAAAVAAILAATMIIAFDEDAPPAVDTATTSTSTRAAAEDGDVEAQFRLGRALLAEAGSDARKGEEAGNWLKRAAGAGHTGAMVLLGKRYRSGIGTPQNFELAARWLGEAARAGDPEGMVEFGRLYRSGIGVKPDAVEAYVWFNRAAAAMNMEGVHERDSVALKLNPEDLRRAQALSIDEAELAPATAEPGTAAPAEPVAPAAGD